MKPETSKNELSHNPAPSTPSQPTVNQPTPANSAPLHPAPTGPAIATPPSPPSPSSPPEPQPPTVSTPPVRPVFSAAAPENQEAILDSRIESIARLKRAGSFLRSLTPDQSRQLYKWILELENINEVHTRVTAPPPEGLGLTVSHITLRRLRSHWQAVGDIDYTQHMLDIITDMEVQSELNQPARIQNAICHLLQQKAFDLAMKVPGSEVLKDVLAGIEKLTTLDLKRQKLALERERLLRKPAAAPATATTQHHRVDVNIVPPNSPNPRPSVAVHSEPHEPAQLQSPQPPTS